MINAGLSDRYREDLQVRLDNEAKEMSGEMMLGHLCDLAKDILTERNHPEGSCAFCLEQLAESEAKCRNNQTKLILVPCYHCFHR